MKTAVILLAPGFEEVEAITPADYLKRAGIAVILCSISQDRIVEGAHGLKLGADTTLEALPEGYDCLVVPGGMPGTTNIAKHKACVELIRAQAASGALIGAICAAPALVLGKAAGLLAGKRFTCYPGMEGEFSGGIHSAGRVVRDGNIITSRAAGTAGEFAIALIDALLGSMSAAKVAQSLLLGSP